MKPPNTYLCALATSLLALACIQSVKGEEENCCGDTRYDPASEECCGGTTPVPKGRCCNGEELEEGFECCKDGVEFQNPYDPETECCVNPYARIISKFEFTDYTECDNRVAREGGGDDGDDGDGTCTSSPDDPVSAVPGCGDEESSFLPACLAHDSCFGHCQSGVATAAFNACNKAFDDDIRAICDSLDSSICRTACNGFRRVYVAGVGTSTGRGHFDSGQNNACQCCP